MENKIIYYHNPRCSKSRQGLELLNSKNIEPKIKEYLKEGVSVEEFSTLLMALKLSPLEGVIRVKEPLFKELGLNEKNLTDKEWAVVVAENPSLLERPILRVGKEAIIGRPTENLLKIL